MWQDSFIERVRRSLEQEPTIVGLFLAGSFALGRADAHSDVDFLVVIAPEDHAEMVRTWRKLLEASTHIVFWNEIQKGVHIVNAITEDWQRIDLVVAGQDEIMKRSKDTLQPLIDRRRLYDELPASIPWTGPNRGYVAQLIKEFLRVLGLLVVVVGRREYLLGISGVDLLRMMLFNLLSEELERADKGGMLAWSRRLSEEQLSLLGGIPAVAATRESIIEAHLACASAFLSRARPMAKTWGIEWPVAFEDATWKHLERNIGIRRPAVAP